MPVAKFKKKTLLGRSTSCPKETHYLLMPVAPFQDGGRFATVDVSTLKSDSFIDARCAIQEGGRFAAVVVSISNKKAAASQP